MKRPILLFLAVLVTSLPLTARGEGREAFAEGLRLLKKGSAAEALTELLKAESSYQEADQKLPTSLLSNLAVAAWRAGKTGEAEAFAERAAARGEELSFLRDSIVGGARMLDASKSMKERKLDAAKSSLERAFRALRAAMAERPESLEAARNLERALRLRKELEKLEEQAKKDKKKDDKKNDKKKNDKKNKKDKGKQNKQKKGDKKGQQKKEGKKPDQGKQDPKKQDPGKQKKDPEKKPEKKKPEKKPEKKKAASSKKQQKKAGEKGKKSPMQTRPMQLSPEQKKRLMRKLQQLLEAKKALQKQRAPRHKPGKRDW